MQAIWPVGTLQPGALLVDGELLGTWRRRGRRVEVRPLVDVAPRTRRAAEVEAAGLPLDLDDSPTVRWSEG